MKQCAGGGPSATLGASAVRYILFLLTTLAVAASPSSATAQSANAARIGLSQPVTVSNPMGHPSADPNAPARLADGSGTNASQGAMMGFIVGALFGALVSGNRGIQNTAFSAIVFGLIGAFFGFFVGLSESK